MCRQRLSSGYIMQQSTPEFALGLAELQVEVFPNLSAEERFTSEMYLKHIAQFPEGQILILDDNKVIGATTTMRYNCTETSHTFLDIFGRGELEKHEPNGEYLYGLDISVSTAYRGKGLAKVMYAARQNLVKKFKLKGQLTVGMLNGYHLYKDKMTIDEYYQKVADDELFDSTVSVQKKVGFKMIQLVKDYLSDPTCGNAGAMLLMDAQHKITIK